MSYVSIKKFTLIENNPPIVAIASVDIGGGIRIYGIRLVETDGLYVQFPEYQSSKGMRKAVSFSPDVLPIVKNCIIDEYKSRKIFTLREINRELRQNG